MNLRKSLLIEILIIFFVSKLIKMKLWIKLLQKNYFARKYLVRYVIYRSSRWKFHLEEFHIRLQESFPSFTFHQKNYFLDTVSRSYIIIFHSQCLIYLFIYFRNDLRIKLHGGKGLTGSTCGKGNVDQFVEGWLDGWRQRWLKRHPSGACHFSCGACIAHVQSRFVSS